MPPKLPTLPKLSEHLPPNPLKVVMQDIQETVDSFRTEVESVADTFRIEPTKTGQNLTKKPAFVTKAPENVTAKPENEPGTCLPCQAMKELREAVGKRKVDLALKTLKEKGIEPDNVEILRKYIAGEDVY
jgi:hypothetical protein